MKFYKITLGKGSGGLIYPSSYQSQIGNHALDHLYYDENDVTKLLLILPDTVANVVRPGVEEINEVEARE